MTILRVCSDCHGCIDNRNRFQDLPSFIELCQDVGPNDYVVQLGDLGFEYSPLNQLDPNKVKVILGNHSNYDTAFNFPHILGHYGVAELGPFKFFYVRGAFSLDKKYRIADEKLTGYKSWWENEQLTHKQGLDALDLYEQVRPDVVFSHDCPTDISYLIGNPSIVMAFGYPRDMISSTQELLQQMWNIHKPKLHIFGHYHLSWEVKYKGTHFRCIAERQFIDFNENWEIVGRTGEKSGSMA